MSEIEKAKELIIKFINVPDAALQEGSNKAWIDRLMAKQCALIATDQIIDVLKNIAFNYDLNMDIEIEWQNKIKQAIQTI